MPDGTKPLPASILNIMNWTFINNLKWNSSQHTNVFVEGQVFQNVVCKMATILFSHQHVTKLFCPFALLWLISSKQGPNIECVMSIPYTCIYISKWYATYAHIHICKVFSAKSRYLGHGKVITSRSILCNIITYLRSVRNLSQQRIASNVQFSSCPIRLMKICTTINKVFQKSQMRT